MTRALRIGAMIAALLGASLALAPAQAAEGESPVSVDNSLKIKPPAPENQPQAAADAKSQGCVSCHYPVDQPTMHDNPAVVLGCADCHGGDPLIQVERNLPREHPDYVAAMEAAHVLPRYPKTWHWPDSANPERTYTLVNKEASEYVRFVNPSDYRVARDACGACHLNIIVAAERSLMATGAMLWGGASYNNGILPFKSYILGTAYTKDGDPALLMSPFAEIKPGDSLPSFEDSAEAARAQERGGLPFLAPLPRWETIPPADVFRVFERGGRNIITQFPEIGLPNVIGNIQRLEEPGRPDIRQSNRGEGTGLRIAVPVINIHKTRLNDPFTWMIGTNDQPGDFRSSGCASCHVVYANDREPRHSLTYAQYGHWGGSQQVDPTIPKYDPEKARGPDGRPNMDYIKKVKGHPLKHEFTRSIPTSQCMICHMHQPNMFLNTYLGYTMWDYESDADLMWPDAQRYPTIHERREVLERNPEMASILGSWNDVGFLSEVYDRVNPRARHTQFADYHGHGWNFRAIFKRDRKGNLLDADGNIVSPDDPEKFARVGEPKWLYPKGEPSPHTNKGKAVHMMSIHAEVGMQCADCHFAQDSHGSGLIVGEVANGVEIRCRDCHGTADAPPDLRTSGPAAPPYGHDLSILRNPDGKRRFEWVGDRLIQRSIIDPNLEWEVKLVKHSLDPTHRDYNPKAARAKLMSRDGDGHWGPDVAKSERAHQEDELACFSCHFAWTTSCGGCHLPIEANWLTERHIYEGGITRNWASYNPQVARDQMYQLGRHQTTKGRIIAPIRSSSALVLSSTNTNRERIYVQQAPVAASGYSSQAFAPHFPHTVRTTETRQCEDCHLSEQGDNNAIMAQLLTLGTNFVNFVGFHAYLGLDGGVQAVRVTEWDEPQAVIGSYLHSEAYPDYFRLHVERNGRELVEWERGEIFDASAGFTGETKSVEQFRNPSQSGGRSQCLQLRGEYLYTAAGPEGFVAYDVASVANKGISDPLLIAPFSPLGHDARISSANATCVALPTNQPIHPDRQTDFDVTVNQEQPFHPIYDYAFITDSEEGLILVDVNTLSDGDPLNNFFERAVTWNEGGVLDGARHITIGGHFLYIAADRGLVVVDVDDPLRPRHVTTLPMGDVRASALQFRYLFVATGRGLEVVDVTRLDDPRVVEGALVPLDDANRVYVARTYAYVAAKAQGLAIIDVERPEAPRLHQLYDAGGAMNDAHDVIVATTNASLIGYVADGRNGLKVLQLTSPSSQPNFYGFSPEPRPELIAFARTDWPALALSKGLDRDRAVDESGHQMAVFGRLGSRPFTRAEMEAFFLNDAGRPYFVTNDD